MTHKQEFKQFKTICGWTEEEILQGKCESSIKLLYKDVLGKTTQADQIQIVIESLLLYNNVDFIPQSELKAAVNKIIKLVKK